MIIQHISLKNWRNFKTLNFHMANRIFVVGPNASGKSNLLDAFRFIRDLSAPGGGLQEAINLRGGMSKIRCLLARQDPDVGFKIQLYDAINKSTWVYELEIGQEPRGKHRPIVKKEVVVCNQEVILTRPDTNDKTDPERLIQTHLEQINANSVFRCIAEFFVETTYLHLVPQLIRYPEYSGNHASPSDPFGRNFMEKISKTPEATRSRRLQKIEEALKVAVPQFVGLSFVKDDVGIPHLQANYSHWRSQGAKHQEREFSDGTLRLIGLLWSLLEGDSLLLLEEPELYLNSEIIKRIPGIISRLQNSRKQKRQLIISTHSPEMLSDKSISASEVLILKPGGEGTTGSLGIADQEVKILMENGMSAAHAIIPLTAPDMIEQLEMF